MNQLFAHLVTRVSVCSSLSFQPANGINCAQVACYLLTITLVIRIPPSPQKREEEKKKGRKTNQPIQQQNNKQQQETTKLLVIVI